METKFCTVTRHDEELYRELMKQNGWKLNVFRKYYATFCILALIAVTAVRAVIVSRGTGTELIPAARAFFAIGFAAAAAAFVLELKNAFKREEKTLHLKAQQKMQQSGKAGEKEEIHWYEDCCVIDTEEISSRYEYTGLKKVEEGDKYIFITFGGDVTVAADKNGFRQGKPDKLKKFLDGKTGRLDKI
ncbi:YcxB family protein [Clostridium sp. AM58-1XD]|uniref:YcxB family protein n=1 Tax=Clostridium sp. AM58-1XD TaxID=2292307 RepID=UPI000E49852C|nr:YcxB family protein [Clostridium sp. AM58-1XD]RGZ00619.1 YcxB family protein [Clostridium sp. AM58-1XD]